MTYRIEIPQAIDGDVVTPVMHGAILSVRLNGRVLTRDEYLLSCTHERDVAGCPACLERNEGLSLGDGTSISRGVGIKPRGNWGAHPEL
jgi:hypothetical protein